MSQSEIVSNCLYKEKISKRFYVKCDRVTPLFREKDMFADRNPGLWPESSC